MLCRVESKFNERIEKAGPEFVERLKMFKQAKNDFIAIPPRVQRYAALQAIYA